VLGSLIPKISITQFFDAESSAASVEKQKKFIDPSCRQSLLSRSFSLPDDELTNNDESVSSNILDDKFVYNSSDDESGSFSDTSPDMSRATSTSQAPLIVISRNPSLTDTTIESLVNVDQPDPSFLDPSYTNSDWGSFSGRNVEGFSTSVNYAKLSTCSRDTIINTGSPFFGGCLSGFHKRRNAHHRRFVLPTYTYPYCPNLGVQKGIEL